MFFGMFGLMTPRCLSYFLEYSDFEISLEDYYVSRSFDGGLKALKDMCTGTKEVIFVFKIDGQYWYNMTGEFVLENHPIFPYMAANQKGINLSSVGGDIHHVHIHPLICEKFRFSKLLTSELDGFLKLPWKDKRNYLKEVQRWARFSMVRPSDKDIESFCFYADKYPMLRNFYIVSPYGIVKIAVINATELKKHCLSAEVQVLGYEVCKGKTTMETAIGKISISGVFDIQFSKYDKLGEPLEISDEEIIKTYDDKTRTTFLKAAQSADLLTVKVMLAKFPDLLLATSTTDRFTVLHYAAMSGINKESLDETKLLLEYLIEKCNVDMNIVDKHGRTPQALMSIKQKVETSQVQHKKFTSVIDYLVLLQNKHL
jgi:hypothetical protein